MKFLKVLGLALLLSSQLANAAPTVSSQISSITGTSATNATVSVLFGSTSNTGVYSNGTSVIYPSLLGIALANISISSDGGGSTATISSAENQSTVTALSISGATGSLSFSLSGTDAASFIIDANGVLTFIVDANYENKSSYSIIVTATDAGTNTSTSQTITVNITDVNEAPSFTNNGGTVATEDSTYTYTPTVSDPDGDLTTISATTLPSWLSLTTIGSDEVTTFAGDGFSGSTDGAGVSASFNKPKGIAIDSSGNVYVADTDNHLIRKIASNGNVTTLAGDGFSGSTDGAGSAASFNSPTGVAVDSSGNVYVADTNNHLIRKIDSAGNVTTLAGVGDGVSGSTDGVGSAASFGSPNGVAVDGNGNV